MAAAAERVAIVGVGAIFPGAPDLGQFWEIVSGGIDATSEVPEGRWALAPGDAHDPRPVSPDRVPSLRAGFVNAEGLDPEFAGPLDVSVRLALHAGRSAWRDAKTDGIDPTRVGVILGHIVLPTEGASALARQTLGRAFAESLDLPADSEADVDPRAAFAAGLPAGMLAKSLGLKGAAYTLDAACASSLYALKLAADELTSGRADVMLTGGVSRPDPLYTQMGFAQLRALSPGGHPRPFDAGGDGLVVGEGAGVFVLKRLGDAVAAGDRIYAVVAGSGLSNDVDGGLLAPSTEGQLRAMRAAYENAGWAPGDVDLIECHATGTPLGDSVELASLRELWAGEKGKPGRCIIGSVKSNIGHALTAAGSAGLLKVLQSFEHGVLPPTANFASPLEPLEDPSSPFRVLAESAHWPERTAGRARRAAISGFGFGGINAHILLEEWRPPARPFVPRPRPKVKPGVPLAIVSLAAQVGPCATTQAFRVRALGGGSQAGPAAPARWWGIADAPAGYYLETLELPADRFRIPPLELEEMLPQQSLLLRLAGEAIAEAGWQRGTPRLRTGVFVGLGLDLNTTNYHVRWWLLPQARRWNEQLGLGLDEAGVVAWAGRLRDAFGPPLSANRTMGALGGLVASRIAREFRAGGPSFTVSSEETSGLRALEVASGMLRRGEIDEALVGAVDFAGDPRYALAAAALHPDRTTPADGGVALVLKRLDDAERDGDPILAVVRGVGSACGGSPQEVIPGAAAARTSFALACADAGLDVTALAYLERADAEPVLFHGMQGDAVATLGHAGAAAGLVGLARLAAGLQHDMIPGQVGQSAASPAPQFWLRDRADGPRRGAVAATGTDGTSLHAILEGYEGPNRAAPSPQPLGDRPFGLFAVEADDPQTLCARLDELYALADTRQNEPIEALARRWWGMHPNDPARTLGVAIVAADAADLARSVASVDKGTVAPSSRDRAGRRVFVASDPANPLGGSKVAFVFPGSGSHFAGMGRDLAAHWPEALRGQDAGSVHLKGQFAPDLFWADAIPPQFDDHRAPILGQVSFGAMVADLIAPLLRPDAVVGYSLGETAGLFATHAWTGRDLIWRRLRESSLFRDDLAGPCNAARLVWNLRPDEPVDWVAGVIPKPAEAVDAAIVGIPRVYRLIANTPRETVIGGQRRAVGEVIARVGGPFVLLSAVSTVHCGLLAPVQDAYRALHLLETTPPPGVTFYISAAGEPYIPDRDSAADAITEHALRGFDYPAMIRRAYDDGHRVFVEIGPGSSCSRMIGEILGDLPHMARPLAVAGHDAVATLLEGLAHLIAERVPLDLTSLYGSTETTPENEAKPGRTIQVAIGGAPFDPPEGLAQGRGIETASVVPASATRENGDAAHVEAKVPGLRSTVGLPPQPPTARPKPAEPRPLAASLPETVDFKPTPAYAEQTPPRELPDMATDAPPQHRNGQSPSPAVPSYRWTEPAIMPTFDDSVVGQPFFAAEAARGEAHAAYLRASGDLARTMADQIAFQMTLIDALAGNPAAASLPAYPDLEDESEAVTRVVTSPAPLDIATGQVPRALDRAQCLAYAIGRIGDVLGPDFAEVDAFPTRVRLPDEPLMLVDRILEIDGEPRSMTSGRVVTEHDIHPGMWYLDGGRIPTCIAVEAGQADLFLSGFLGIDFITEGLAVYRLLDAVVTFHRPLPGVGEVIHYDIHVDGFFRQADTWLFRFRFEATVGGQPLLSMQEGCAGFFTAEALAAGKGIVRSTLEAKTRADGRGGTVPPLVPMALEQLDADRVEALRLGNLAAAFGPAFDGLPLAEPQRLPGGPMTLVHRVERIDPAGGTYGLGLIRGEADIHADDWFMTCHFVDDRVMPGTLMFECCLHTLRIYLARMGWVGEHDAVTCGPVPGIASRLKCRGQVIESTRMVTYEVSIKELGYGPEPYAIVDALMYADGKPIVEITDMSLRFEGLTLETLQATWAGRQASPEFVVTPEASPQPPVYDAASIRAFAIGNPSEAFGAPYRIFDEGRVIARLPGPPYQFLDRVISTKGEPWAMVAGAGATAEYDVPADAWYFSADRQPLMPFCVLLEAALQPCGWLAAYVGSALTSDVDLSFRNLGGQARQLIEVTPHVGTMTTEVTLTKVSSSGGMIIQHYDYRMTTSGGEVVYEGDTYFGFFAKQALANQVGFREASFYQPTEAELARSKSFDYPREAPFPDDRWRMIDRVEHLIADGGPAGLGYIRGKKPVDPSAWFFKAHFHQDPVVPGSLGLESFLQLLKLMAAERWGVDPSTVFLSAGPAEAHRWVYRGQVVPGDTLMTTEATVIEVDDQRHLLVADGLLGVDGRLIYQMGRFTAGLLEAEAR
ncbi:beta-ketoacyl synthase N-terminal-like domain-containing protein [Isosphaeraceae bacterium EP7]